MTTTQPRAKQGGEVGVNGEFYEGGKFLPTTDRSKGKPRKKSTGKVEIEPYVWVIAPTAYHSPILKKIGGLIHLETGAYNPVTIEFHGLDITELLELWKRYKAGERWVTTVVNPDDVLAYGSYEEYKAMTE